MAMVERHHTHGDIERKAWQCSREINDDGDLPPLRIPRRPYVIPLERSRSTASVRSVVSEPNFLGPDDETALSFKRNTKDDLVTDFAYNCPHTQLDITACVTPDNDSNTTKSSIDKTKGIADAKEFRSDVLSSRRLKRSDNQIGTRGRSPTGRHRNIPVAETGADTYHDKVMTEEEKSKSWLCCSEAMFTFSHIKDSWIG